MEKKQTHLPLKMLKMLFFTGVWLTITLVYAHLAPRCKPDNQGRNNNRSCPQLFQRIAYLFLFFGHTVTLLIDPVLIWLFTPYFVRCERKQNWWRHAWLRDSRDLQRDEWKEIQILVEQLCVTGKILLDTTMSSNTSWNRSKSNQRE